MVLGGRPNLYGAIDERERHRLELIIATARGFLAAIALLAISVDPTEPTRYAGFAFNLLVFYDIHSFAVLLLLKFGPISTARLGPLLHAIDLCWAVSITFLTEGPNSSYFALFMFVLLAAAYRWGYRETLITGLVTALLLLLEAIAVSLGLVDAIVDLNSLIMRSAYFLLATFLLAYLSDQAKGLRAGAAVITRLTSRVDVREGLATSMRMVLEELLRLVGAGEAIVVLREIATNRIVLWKAALDPSSDSANLYTSNLQGDQENEYLAPRFEEATAWEAKRSKGTAGALEWLALDDDGRLLRKVRGEVPAALKERPWAVLLCVSVGFGNDWSGRVFLLDPTVRPSGERRLRVLQGVMANIAPVLHNVYLLGKLRLRIGAIERARVARELHDSVLQSLTSIEMQIDVVRRDPSLGARPAGELEHIQNLLRQEILDTRDLMDHLRPRVADVRHLIERLTDLADRVRRETEIDVHCRIDIGPVDVPPELCFEIGRMVQEALINVRKHSGASDVQISLRIDDWAWRLSISDNGRGLGINGTMSHAELVARRVGPSTIRERAEAVGGKLQLRSGPDGLLLEIVGRLKKPWILTPSV